MNIFKQLYKQIFFSKPYVEETIVVTYLHGLQLWYATVLFFFFFFWLPPKDGLNTECGGSTHVSWNQML